MKKTWENVRKPTIGNLEVLLLIYIDTVEVSAYFHLTLQKLIYTKHRFCMHRDLTVNMAKTKVNHRFGLDLEGMHTYTVQGVLRTKWSPSLCFIKG